MNYKVLIDGLVVVLLLVLRVIGGRSLRVAKRGHSLGYKVIVEMKVADRFVPFVDMFVWKHGSKE